MGSDDVFRLNFDLWRDYKVEVNVGGFRVEDPAGRVVDEGRVSKFLWRRPTRTHNSLPGALASDEDRYSEGEVWYAVQEIVNLLWARAKVVLVEPHADRRVGKFVQLRAAGRYFDVPDYQFRLGFPSKFGARGVVVKSLTFEPVGVDKEGRPSVIFATKVNSRDLATSSPWMVQEYVAADFDVTVAVVRDKMFAFGLDRHKFPKDVADWRELSMQETTDNWRVHELPLQMERSIFRLMDDLMLHFARIDFLLKDGRYFFLELNPNGHWAWLDAEGKHGLLDKIVDEISPRTRCHPIPFKLSQARR